MYMSYTKDPNLPQVRMRAVELVKYHGWGLRKAARHFGFSHCALRLWLKREPVIGPRHQLVIPTRSSRPNHHPHELSKEIVWKILDMRSERKQCAEILHHRLGQEGIAVSLSSVKRVLKRNHISKYSPWKKWHAYPPRPMPEKPGILVEIDTIHDGPAGEQFYVYTGLDVCSRFAYAIASERINTHRSLAFIEKMREAVPFPIATLQSDHGSEFSKWFTKRIVERGMAHRHSRVRQPNDNAHLERFNRTIQEECISRVSRSLKAWKKEIPIYLRYYNFERPHMGIDYQTPMEVVTSY
jgi:transposase InsO family protein